MPALDGSFRGFSSVLLMLIILHVWNATAVFAEWEFVDGNEQAKVYVDSETITRDGGLVSATNITPS